MDNRREFLKKVGLAAGGSALFNSLPAAIQKALAINPAAGSTFMDAEHVVILMQENRSFDHALGSLQGVRGFNDPRAIQQPNGNSVFLQSNKAGETYAPFRLNIEDTKATWMGSLPHSWENQVDARNNGNMNGWLEAKRPGNKAFAHMPLTMGYYNRKDIPFYYDLADAFTVCDQHFCSSLTGTTPNRLYLWTGTLRHDSLASSPANVRNSEVDYGKEANWHTFPEKLEDAGVSWKIYQNEISLPTGFEGEEESWLSNFTDNPIEWFSQYHVRRHPKYVEFIVTAMPKLEAIISTAEAKLTNAAASDVEGLRKELAGLKRNQRYLINELKLHEKEQASNFDEHAKSLHSKAFSTNIGDADYRKVSKLNYTENGQDRETYVPASDVLFQFRKDVNEGKLPAVSWVVAPENFSDHPGAPWFGAWYVSEVMDILTKNEEVWKKTIFILTYDENDGYFDHVPPFVAPDIADPSTGAVSSGIKDAAAEYVTIENEMAKPGMKRENARKSPIGLGFRVPMIVASPWSRGGYVNSQVFDHTSVVQFLEGFASRMAKKEVKETNITSWRRAVCGNLHSIFRPYNGEQIGTPPFLKRDAFIEEITNARYKPLPAGYTLLDAAAVAKAKTHLADIVPQQEPGTRPANALPYELYADAIFNKEKDRIDIRLSAGNKLFGQHAAGVAFHVYSTVGYMAGNNVLDGKNWDYAVAPGEEIKTSYPLSLFNEKAYDLKLYGPNGFYRQFKGNNTSPSLSVICKYEVNANKPTGNIVLELLSAKALDIQIVDNSYKQKPISKKLIADKILKVTIPLSNSQHWYDFSVWVNGNNSFEQRYAGHVETGMESITDPLMGGMV